MKGSPSHELVRPLRTVMCGALWLVVDVMSACVGTRPDIPSNATIAVPRVEDTAWRLHFH